MSSEVRSEGRVTERPLRYEVAPGVFYDAHMSSFQDDDGVDVSLVDQTLAMSPDERVQHLDAWINSMRALQADLASHCEGAAHAPSMEMASRER